MKQLILQTLIIVLAVITLNAQTPEAFKYQAVARGTNGQPLTNQAINLRISILQTSASGTTVYAETHSATTNDFGLFTLNIGEGTIETGNFSTIDWGADNYFIQVEMDETGGTSYNLMGTSQLLSVPYALYAESANTVANDQVDDADADPANEIQSISEVLNIGQDAQSDSIVNLGSIGIGTSTPDYPLDVNGTAQCTQLTFNNNSSDVYPAIWADEVKIINLSTTEVNLGFITGNASIIDFMILTEDPLNPYSGNHDLVTFTLYKHLAAGNNNLYSIEGGSSYVTTISAQEFEITIPGSTIVYRLVLSWANSSISLKTTSGTVPVTTVRYIMKRFW